MTLFPPINTAGAEGPPQPLINHFNRSGEVGALLDYCAASLAHALLLVAPLALLCRQ